MCGIAGICNLERDDAPDPMVLRRMLATIRHRGSDQFGIYSDRSAMIGSARLSIVDLQSGQQPITNEDRSLWIVFNGEVFNHVELRAGLERRGHVFQTRTDTEVILHLFEEDGPAFLHQLNGDFAMAIWNSNRRELFLARDRVGVRPLFHATHAGRLLFGSEVKAILADPTYPAAIDPLALNEIFTFWSTLSPRTAFQGVAELPPGTYAVVRDGRMTVHRWWHLDFSPNPGVAARGTDDLADELADLLTDATRLRLRADVSVGAYLSGGLDSSAVTAIARSLVGEKLETFSIAFTDERFDESNHQQRMARTLGTAHHVVQATHADIGRVFPDVIRHIETPVLRTAPAPMFLLSGLACESGLKVVLTGEGADEFLGGYDIFKEAMIRHFWARQPSSRRRPQLLRRLYPELGFDEAKLPVLAEFFRAGLEDVDSPFYSHAIRWRNTARARRFLSEAIALHGSPHPNPGRAADSRFPQWHPLSRAQHLEITIFLAQYLLSSQGDRPAMAHGVEGRYPFLDHRLIEFACALPPFQKLRGLCEKFLLRKAAARWLPREVASRRKQPYRAPIHRSFLGPDGPGYVLDLLSPEAVAAAGYFKPGAVSALTGKLRRGAPAGETDDMALAGIISTQLLHETFIRGRRTAPDLRASDDVKCVWNIGRAPAPAGRRPVPAAPALSHFPRI